MQDFIFSNDFSRNIDAMIYTCGFENLSVRLIVDKLPRTDQKCVSFPQMKNLPSGLIDSAAPEHISITDRMTRCGCAMKKCLRRISCVKTVT